MLIKVEAVNIYGFAYDSLDLSSVRGGSLLLLEMPRKFKLWIKDYYKKDAESIAEGASMGTFRLEGPNLKEFKERAKSWLAEAYPYATIALAAVDTKAGWDYLDLEARLSTEIRLAQMESFSFGGLSQLVGTEICRHDLVRPARLDGMSPSTFAKREAGKDAKQNFLHEHAGIEQAAEWTYTNDLTELSRWERASLLDGKIALFYADGNHFGSHLRDSLSGKKVSGNELQVPIVRRFSEELHENRKKFLVNLLHSTTGSKRWLTSDGKRRLELLLWGGDEVMVAVPAWCGWEVAQIFMNTMSGKSFKAGKTGFALKHGMGLVFAHHKAPIHELVKLVKKLAEDESKQDRKTDRLSYLVLESFDHVGEDLERFRELRCPDEDTRKDFTLSAEGAALEKISATLRELKTYEFPRRKVYQAVIGLSEGKPWSQIEKEITNSLDKTQEDLLKNWQKLTGGESASWYHLADLWDYVGLDLEGAS